jgi:hypothetical protein
VTDSIFDFPNTSRSQDNTGRKLVQMWLAPMVGTRIVIAIDRWLGTQVDRPAGTEAIHRLTSLGLTGELLDDAKRATRRLRP